MSIIPMEFFRHHVHNLAQARAHVEASGNSANLSELDALYQEMNEEWDSILENNVGWQEYAGSVSFDPATVQIYCPECGHKFTQSEKDASYLDMGSYILNCSRCPSQLMFGIHSAFGKSKE